MLKRVFAHVLVFFVVFTCWTFKHILTINVARFPLLTCFSTNLDHVFKTSSNLLWWSFSVVLIVKMTSQERVTLSGNVFSCFEISWYLQKKVVTRCDTCKSNPLNRWVIEKTITMKVTVTTFSKQNLFHVFAITWPTICFTVFASKCLSYSVTLFVTIGQASLK